MPVDVANLGDLGGRDRCGHLAQAGHAVEVGDERDGEPVVAGDLVVSADHDARLSRGAGAQAVGRGGADVIEIDGGVAGRD